MPDFVVRIDGITDDAIDIRTFRLSSTTAEALPRYAPGSHIDVKLADGLIRQYSLCGDPEDRSCYVIGVKKEPESRGGSRFLHEHVKPGDTLTISAPRNNFPLDETAPHSVLLAAGIGATPIIAMADQLNRIGASFEFHYFSRGPAYTAFHDRLSATPYATGLHLHYALSADAVRLALRQLLGHRPTGAQLYLCGPKPFMDTVTEVAAAGWPEDAVHLEYFSAEPATQADADGAFEVSLAQSGGTYTVPADKTIAETLLAHGVDVELSCEQGLCGTCLTGVLEGTADHRDVVMSPSEHAANDRICLCVSRATSPTLVLDL